MKLQNCGRGLRICAGLVLLIFVTSCGSGEKSANEKSTTAGERGVSVSATSAVTKPLNVLLITIDTTRADALGVYGQSLPTTPNIDRIAHGGGIFRNASRAAPITLPSHASIMTGTYPFVHGARTNDGYVLSDENVTLAEKLKEHGYRTAAEIGAVVLNRRTRMDQGFDSYRDLDPPDIKRMAQVFVHEGEQKKLLMQERYAKDITQSGITFLKSARAEPFFLWLHYFSPHAPYVPHPKIAKQIPDDLYLAEVRLVDREIGVLMKAITGLGISENTLVVITSDHGESRGEHRELTHSLFVYESTLHVPLIFAGTNRIPKGVEIGGVVRLVDIAPTIVDLLGLPPMQGVQGVSLVPLFEKPESELDLIAYGESAVPKEIFGSSILRSLRRGKWKMIYKLQPELYDLNDDPSELRDLAKQEPEQLADLRSRLVELISDAPASMGSEHVKLTPLERRQLAMLGYLTGGGEPVSGAESEELAPHGPDPTALIDEMKAYATSQDLWSLGRMEESFEVLRGLVARHPSSRPFSEAYLLACFRLKHYQPAVVVVERTLQRGEELENFWPGFASWLLLVIDARDEGAIPVLERLNDYDRCEEKISLKLAESYHLNGRYGDERALLETGIKDCDFSLNRTNNLANLLATCSQANVRDGKRAVELAMKAAEMTSYKQPAVLDTLASAYAETGDFAKAVETSRRAIALLEAANVPKARLDLYRARLDLLLQAEPVREE